MRKLIAMGMIAGVACAGANEPSFWDALFSSAANTDAATEVAAKTDSGIAKLTQQLKDLKAKMDEAKGMPGDALDGLKKQYEDIRTKLNAKLEEYKTKHSQKSEERRKKAEERKAKIEQAQKDGKDLIDSVKSLFN